MLICALGESLGSFISQSVDGGNPWKSCTSSDGLSPIVIYTTKFHYFSWLVVWNMNFIFHNIWDVILPID